MRWFFALFSCFLLLTQPRLAFSQSLTQNVLTNSTNLRNGLLFYAPCSEGSGTTCYDYSGNGHTLTLTNVSFVSGPPQYNLYALSFPGSGSSYAITNNINLSGPQPRTVSLWFNAGSPTAQYPTLFFFGTDSLCESFSLATTNPGFGLHGYSCDVNPYPISTYFNNSWHNYLVTYTANTVIEYMDCNAIVYSSLTLNTAAFKPIVVGLEAVGYTNTYFNGYLTAPIIWTRALNNQEIQSVCHGGHP